MGSPLESCLRHASDERLVEWARAGDRAAFEQIYERHQPAILSYCRHLTGQLEDAEDAVQHTLLATYRELVEKPAGERPFALRPWLFKVARNRCLTLLRRAGRERATTGVEPSVDGLAVEVERRQELRDLVRDLGRLPEHQRSALLLSELEALSHAQIGAVLGVDTAKVKALVFQARSTLAAGREAREASCQDIRQQIATLTGPALRRRSLRRHVRDCSGCNEFEHAVRARHRGLALILPVAAGPGLREACLPATASGAVAAGGGAGAGVAGSFAALFAKGLAKVALVGVVAGGGTGAVVAAEVVELPRIGSATSADGAARQHAYADPARGSASRPAEALHQAGGAPLPPGASGQPEGREGNRGAREEPEASGPDEEREGAAEAGDGESDTGTELYGAAGEVRSGRGRAGEKGQGGSRGRAGEGGPPAERGRDRGGHVKSKGRSREGAGESAGGRDNRGGQVRSKGGPRGGGGEHGHTGRGGSRRSQGGGSDGGQGGGTGGGQGGGPGGGPPGGPGGGTGGGPGGGAGGGQGGGPGGGQGGGPGGGQSGGPGAGQGSGAGGSFGGGQGGGGGGQVGAIGDGNGERG